MPRVRSVSFAAAGFNAVYYVGVLHYLQTHRERLSPRCLFLGSSSGSVMGPLLVCGVGVRRIMESLVPFMEETRKRKDFWASARRFVRAVFALLPKDAYARCSHRCAVVYTKVSWDTFTAVRRQRFGSNRELYRCVRASCCVPLVTDVAPVRLARDHVGIDGTFSDTQPTVDSQTLRVNATYQRDPHRADIYPPPGVTAARPALMELPSAARLSEIARQGYADTKAYLGGGLAPPVFHVETGGRNYVGHSESEDGGELADAELPHPAPHLAARE